MLDDLLLDSDSAVILTHIAKVSVSGTHRFIAKNHSLNRVNISWIEELLLNNVEDNVKSSVLNVHRLENNSKDSAILYKLGAKAEIKLAHLFELIIRQSKCQKGTLLTNGYANITYIRKETLWVVSASTRWHLENRYWCVIAYSIGTQKWFIGDQVISLDC